MTPGPTSQSIHELPPIERGGTIARHGFDFQDHVAVSFLLSMLDTPALLQVWCETHDDITLIWRNSREEEVEFVQVKSSELNQLWSLAKLCEREKRDGVIAPGTSIYERSLANDRCLEPCRFRLVTCLPTRSDLRVLTLPCPSPDRVAKQQEIDTLAADIAERTAGFASRNGNGPLFWLSRLLWDVRHSLETVKAANIVKLRHLIESEGGYLFSDQEDELYRAILAKVRAAAAADWGGAPEAKKITRAAFREWFCAELQHRQHSIPAMGGSELKAKMKSAGIEAEIESALETRRHYVSERLRPQYLSLSERDHVEGEVTATLHALRSQLDAGELPDSGVTFHAKCISELQQLQKRLSTSRPVPLAFLIGCMYSIADRCVHRFRRVAV